MSRLRVIGLMSGTSMDGIDAAFLETDGESMVAAGPHAGIPYPAELRHVLLSLPADGVDIAGIERQVTDLQSQAVQGLCAGAGIDLRSVDLVGFHGQTIKHEPERRRTVQLGDGRRMAGTLGVPVVNNFRQNDMDHGGQGAPLVPAYHRALASAGGISNPVAILNIGSVSNVTLIDGERLYACDCGPGNALIDDWVSSRCHVPYDDGGKIAASGRVDAAALTALLDHPYFKVAGPKSLDRNAFSLAAVTGLTPADGAATLTAFTAAAIAAEAARLPARPREWIVVGGGRHNQQLLAELRQRLAVPVKTAEDYGWAGDAIEAQACAYLAARSVRRLPLTWPGTTGVRQAVSGGVRWDPPSATEFLLAGRHAR
jgi:anhydro-N-acetylmuramic acid kinase